MFDDFKVRQRGRRFGQSQRLVDHRLDSSSRNRLIRILQDFFSASRLERFFERSREARALSGAEGIASFDIVNLMACGAEPKNRRRSRIICRLRLPVTKRPAAEVVQVPFVSDILKCCSTNFLCLQELIKKKNP